MRNQLTFLIVFLGISLTSVGKGKAGSGSKFNRELHKMIEVANMPSGFDSLKYVELSRGVWNCKLELDGFLPVVEEALYNPVCRLLVSAESVNSIAKGHVKMLLINGLPGYKVQDSETDKTVPIDRTKESRKVVFTKKEQFVTSVVTVIFNAHQYRSVTLRVESW
jgi:hypothetical protein